MLHGSDGQALEITVERDGVERQLVGEGQVGHQVDPGAFRVCRGCCPADHFHVRLGERGFLVGGPHREHGGYGGARRGAGCRTFERERGHRGLLALLVGVGFARRQGRQARYEHDAHERTHGPLCPAAACLLARERGGRQRDEARSRCGRQRDADGVPLVARGRKPLEQGRFKQHVQLQLDRFAGCQRVGLASRGIAVASQFHALRQLGFQSHLVPSDGRVVRNGECDDGLISGFVCVPVERADDLRDGRVVGPCFLGLRMRGKDAGGSDQERGYRQEADRCEGGLGTG